MGLALRRSIAQLARIPVAKVQNGCPVDKHGGVAAALQGSESSWSSHHDMRMLIDANGCAIKRHGARCCKTQV